MNLLLIAATSPEIGPCIQQLRQGPRAFNNVEVLITGVGLTATTYQLMKQLAGNRPDYIVQAGIAGSFDPNLGPGSVCVVEKELIADQGVLESGVWKHTTDMGFTNADALPYSGGWLVNPGPLPQLNLPVVKAITVNQVSTSVAFMEQMASRFNPSIESMEGAALHFVAIAENIPFLQLRAVSNFVGERDKGNWDIKNAVINLNKQLLHLLAIL